MTAKRPPVHHFKKSPLRDRPARHQYRHNPAEEAQPAAEPSANRTSADIMSTDARVMSRASRTSAPKPRRQRAGGGPLVATDPIDPRRSVEALPSRPAPELRAPAYLPSLPAAQPASSPDMMSTAQGIIDAGAARAWRNRSKQAPIGEGQSWGMEGGADDGLGAMRSGGRTKQHSGSADAALSRASRTTGRGGR